MNKLETNDYFVLIKIAIVDEMSSQKDEFKDTDWIQQLIAKSARALN